MANTPYSQSLNEIEKAAARQHEAVDADYNIQLVNLGHQYFKESNLLPIDDKGFNNLVKKFGNFTGDMPELKKLEEQARKDCSEAGRQSNIQDKRINWKRYGWTFLPVVLATAKVVFNVVPFIPNPQALISSGFLALGIFASLPQLPKGAGAERHKWDEKQVQSYEERKNFSRQIEHYPAVETVVRAFVDNNPDLLRLKIADPFDEDIIHLYEPEKEDEIPYADLPALANKILLGYI